MKYLHYYAELYYIMIMAVLLNNIEFKKLIGILISHPWLVIIKSGGAATSRPVILL